MDLLINVIGKFIGTWLIVILIGFFLAWIAMLLWNITIPDVFGLPEITYKQMFCLYLIIKIIFGLNISVNNK